MEAQRGDVKLNWWLLFCLFLNYFLNSFWFIIINHCGGILFIVSQGRLYTRCYFCVSVFVTHTLVTIPCQVCSFGVKELILGNKHLREVLEALITIATMTWNDSSSWQAVIRTHLKKNWRGISHAVSLGPSQCVCEEVCSLRVGSHVPVSRVMWRVDGLNVNSLSQLSSFIQWLIETCVPGLGIFQASTDRKLKLKWLSDPLCWHPQICPPPGFLSLPLSSHSLFFCHTRLLPLPGDLSIISSLLLSSLWLVLFKSLHKI